jgi:2-aminoadipate transaminase
MHRVNNDNPRGSFTLVEFHARDRRPLYQQLAEGIAAQIRNGALPAGTRLPPLRDIAKRQGIALVTASQAYEALAAEGLVEARTGRGTFVSFDSEAVDIRPLRAPAGTSDGEPTQWDSALSRYSAQTRRVAAMQLLRSSFRPGTIPLSNGHTAPETYPLADFARCYARTFLDDPADIHQYRADRGDLRLRELFAERLRARGAEICADDILIVSGAQQALSLVAETFLDHGDFAAAEAPTYFSALEVFDQKRVSWVNLSGDADGASPGSISAAVRRFSPRLMYLNTASQNPTGSFLARSRHREILDVARASKLTIVEDQTCWPLAYEGDAPPPLLSSDTDGRVVLIESISKLLFPSLRIGYIAARGPAMQALYDAKLRADTFTTTVAQRALVRFLESKSAARHLRTTRFLYRRRRDALLAALRGALPDGGRAIAPRGGVNVWVELPRDWSSIALFGYAAQEGVLFLPGAPFYPTMPTQNALRMSFGTLPEDLAGEAMTRFGRAVKRYASDRRKAGGSPAPAIAAV